MKKRYFKRRDKSLPKGYDSKLEVSLHENELKGYDHHPFKLDYTVPHTYEVDFVDPDEPNVVIEVKGRFRDRSEATKYVWVQKCNPDIELVFIFEKPHTPFPFAKKRKDGTKMDHAEWAEKNNFRWYTRDTLPEGWKK